MQPLVTPFRRLRWIIPSLMICLSWTSLSGLATAEQPNVLFISVDDLNDWIGCLKGHPQARTPNIDRLAKSGTLFTNAHCGSPACNGSRSAIMSGQPAYVSGMYDNLQKMRTVMPDAELIPKYFSKHGYWSAGSGKILHYIIDAQSWDEYNPPKETEDPFPRTLYPEQRPVSLPRGGPWQYIETDWGGLDATDEEFGGDWLVSKWIGEQLSREHDKPFFLACGIYRPHEPWFVPQKYFDQFPLDEIQLPPGYAPDDIDDLPPAGKKLARNRYFAHIQNEGQWKQAIQGYLASIAFADAMVGRVITALEEGPNNDNTIVMLWSDHGWHLGEKEHWQKYTGWRVCTRVPLIVRVPPGTSGLDEGTQPGSVCQAPVSLVSLYTTLIELAGLPAKASLHEPSLVPLLKDPQTTWPHMAVTQLMSPENYSVSGSRWRYIHYANGDEELYDVESDPYEWNNLAGDPKFAEPLSRLKQHGPKDPAEFVPPAPSSLTKLKWHPAGSTSVPASNPDGNRFNVTFTNRSGQPVKVFQSVGDQTPQPFGVLESGWSKPQLTRPGTVWLIMDTNDQPLGHFVVGDRTAQAVIPKP
ncbi:sulfatase-like hydrolase/transferase [Novipirellula maiorica]|nr:sulfatase-like hydrolase/transferase [Rhodopirellula maiorica]